MSKWSEAGFPDLRLSNPKIALGAIIKAMNERSIYCPYYDYMQNNIFSKDQTRYIIRQIDHSFGTDETKAIRYITDDSNPNDGYTYIFDGNNSLEHACSLMGEELIPCDRKLSDLYQKDWMLQRYRLLNFTHRALLCSPTEKSYIFGNNHFVQSLLSSCNRYLEPIEEFNSASAAQDSMRTVDFSKKYAHPNMLKFGCVSAVYPYGGDKYYTHDSFNLPAVRIYETLPRERNIMIEHWIKLSDREPPDGFDFYDFGIDANAQHYKMTKEYIATGNGTTQILETYPCLSDIKLPSCPQSIDMPWGKYASYFCSTIMELRCEGGMEYCASSEVWRRSLSL